MEVLWAPWRLAYVTGQAGLPGCLFCTALAAADDARYWIVGRSGTVFLILNAFPYAPGHLMVTPFRHVPSPEDLDDREGHDLMQAIRDALRALRAEYRPDGFNIGVNVGRAAGAGVADHVHFHVVPRWAADTNFMPILGAVKVLPETLDETFRRLRPHLGG